MKFDAEDVSRFPRPVVCMWCNNKHRSSFASAELPDDDHTLGDACATNVWQVTEETQARLAQKDVPANVGDWMANAHYGSNDDCTLWKWVQNFPTAPADPVCDNCIGERVCADDLVRIEGNFP